MTQKAKARRTPRVFSFVLKMSPRKRYSFGKSSGWARLLVKAATYYEHLLMEEDRAAGRVSWEAGAKGNKSNRYHRQEASEDRWIEDKIRDYAIKNAERQGIEVRY